MIYYGIFILMFVLSLSRRYENRNFRIQTILIIVLTCFRATSVGLDTSMGYAVIYNEAAAGGKLRYLEPIFRLINILCVKLNLGQPGVIALCGLLTIIPTVYVISKCSENKTFSLALYYGMYFVLFSFNMMRQCVGISFVLLATYFYTRKKDRADIVRAIISFAIAVMFHKSSLFALLIIIFLLVREFKIQHIIFFSIFSLLIGLALSQNIISRVLSLLGMYSNYITQSGYRGFRSSIIIPLILCILFNGLFIFLVSVKADGFRNDHWFKIAFLGIIVMNMTFKLGQGTRMVLFFSQAQFVFFPNYFKKICSSRTRLSTIAIYMIYITLNFVRMLSSEIEWLTPYLFFWQ